MLQLRYLSEVRLVLVIGIAAKSGDHRSQNKTKMLFIKGETLGNVNKDLHSCGENICTK